ncbi:hypothetical protein NL676_022776 [Syzygium grande]|nr:hypothetical protein NL676_022776 [Syzygium grande]
MGENTQFDTRPERESSVSEENEHIPSSFTLRGNNPIVTRRCCFKSPPVALAATSLAESRSNSPASNFVDVFVNEVAGLLLHLLPLVAHTISVPPSHQSGDVATAYQIASVSLIQYRKRPFKETQRKVID